MDAQKNGLFITFEGGEGTGKTTQSKMLCEFLNNAGLKTIWTREIGGTPAGEDIRTVFFKHDIDPLTELLLSTAARNEHIIHKIAPNLDTGVSIVCDRFIDTSSVYRSISGRFSQEEIYFEHHKFFPNFWPEITFLLDIDPEVSLQRVLERGGEKSKYDDAELSFHTSIRNGFLYSAKLYPNRFVTIDANQSVQSVHEQIIHELKAM